MDNYAVHKEKPESPPLKVKVDNNIVDKKRVRLIFLVAFICRCFEESGIVGIWLHDIIFYEQNWGKKLVLLAYIQIKKIDRDK